MFKLHDCTSFYVFGFPVFGACLILCHCAAVGDNKTYFTKTKRFCLFFKERVQSLLQVSLLKKLQRFL